MKLQDTFRDFNKVREFRQGYLALLENSLWSDPAHILFTMKEHSAVSIPFTGVMFVGYREGGRLRLRSNAVMESDAVNARLTQIFQLLGISDQLERFRNVAESMPVPFLRKAYAGIESGTPYPSFGGMLQGICDSPVKDCFRGGIGAYADTDWLISLNIRVDHIFTGGKVVVSLEMKNYDTVDSNWHWPITGFETTEAGNSDIDAIRSLFDQLTFKMFYGTRKFEPRISLDYPQDSDDFIAANKWLDGPGREYSYRNDLLSTVLNADTE